MELKVNSKKHGEFKVLIDDEDYDKIKDYGWCVSKYSKCEQIYLIANSREKNKPNVRLHTLIMNPPKGMLVDHINRNTMDNRKCNLRICSKKENGRNTKKQCNGITSKYKGVCFLKRRNHFVATITVSQKSKYIGSFHSEDDAAKAYNEAAVKYFGEFANLNIIS